jgi:hypothetical protein
MQCLECNATNHAESRYCEFCGNSLADAPQDDRVAVALPSPGSLPQPGANSAPAVPQDIARLSTTRWLCAAVTVDQGLEHRVLEQVLEEQRRAVVTTPGVDLVSVLKYALAAHRRRVIRDGILLADLCLLIVTILFLRSVPLFFLLLVVAWVTVFVERFTSLYGSVIRGLQPGNFDPDKGYSPPRDSYAGRQLRRIAETGTTGNVTLYSGFSPFRGYGTVLETWSFAIDITRPAGSRLRPGSRPEPTHFTALDVYDYVKTRLSELDLGGLQLTDRLFVDGRDIKNDQRFLPQQGRPPVTSVEPEFIRRMLAQPEEGARPYLTITRTGWQGDLVMTTFIRFLVSASDLFVEAAHTVVPPLRAEFKAIDERDLGQETTEIFGLSVSSFISTIPRLLGSVGGIFHEITADSRREKKLRRAEKNRDYGALASVRELAADSKWHRYFQIFDDEHFVKVVEQRIFRSLVEFLDQHNIDTRTLESRAETLINNGVMFGNNASIKDSQVAGAGSRMDRFMPRGGERSD